MTITLKQTDGRTNRFSFKKTYPGEHTSWRGMTERCRNKNHKHYEHYGGRGISVHKEWLGSNGFKTFLKDMGKRPADHTLDRIDNDGNYEPSNCQWATQTEQVRNSSRNKFIVVGGKKVHVTDFIRENGVPLSSFYKASRLYKSHQKASEVILKNRGKRNYIVNNQI